MSMLPMTPFERIVKKTGIKRVSREALEEMRDCIEEIAMDMSEQAARISNHAGRKTVREEDMLFVAGKKK
ncbi:MAG: NFYB/HAP3 family transcription factor subunit [Candidatus Aenigmarchaeota archaeon]|nr:NFYB/HAP3 family transcription factor subunit [Candidatus Aenigmarchaeota archaeon]